jgi:uncharacterized membrane protein
MPSVLYLLASALAGGVIGAVLAGLVPRSRRNAARTAVEQIEFMRNLLAFLLVGSFISVLPVLTFKAIPSENKDLITYMLGQLSGMATMALGFYFVNKAGQDALDEKKADNTKAMAEAVTETAKAAQAAQGTGEAVNDGVIRDGDAVEVRKPPE